MSTSNRRPLIALTPQFNTETDEPYMKPAYLKAIHAAGGTPLILPLDLEQEELRQLAETFDGFLFTGGPDIHPFYFGEQTQRNCGNVSLRRDRLELTLLELAMEAEKPILGICRGIQLINIGLGGDIYQDIPSQFPEDFPIAHMQPFYYDIPSHAVEVVPGSLLARIAQSETIQVNSKHHQAVRNVAPGLLATGFAPNQLVECVEKPDYPNFFLAVQWHPEYMWENDPVAKGIFAEFVGSCAR